MTTTTDLTPGEHPPLPTAAASRAEMAPHVPAVLALLRGGGHDDLVAMVLGDVTLQDEDDARALAVAFKLMGGAA